MSRILKTKYLIFIFVIHNSAQAAEYQSLSTSINSPHQRILKAIEEYEPSKALSIIRETSGYDEEYESGETITNCHYKEILRKAIEKYIFEQQSVKNPNLNLTEDIKERFLSEARDYLEIIKLIHKKLNLPLKMEEFYKEPCCCIIL